jgi:hypothetical protein
MDCLPGAYDRREAAYEQLPAETQRFWRRQGYVRGANVAAPQVVHFDGVIASFAAMKLHDWVADFSSKSNVAVFDFINQAMQTITYRRPADQECLVCSPSGLLALGDLEPFQVGV